MKALALNDRPQQLEQKDEAATTPEERTRWTRIRDSVVGAGRDFAIELGAAMAARTMGA